MNHSSAKRRAFSSVLLAAGVWVWLHSSATGLAQTRRDTESQQSFVSWESAARLHYFAGKDKGDLSINANGIEFRRKKAEPMKIPYVEVQTFQLEPQSLTIKTYRNRKMGLGVAQYRFDLVQSVPPSVAAELASRVRKPSQNSVPDPDSQAVTISAHHRTVRGGTNGVLRFHEGGIDYVSSASGDSRSWRWADLQTLSAPDPYHLLLFGYRDTYNFDLKEMLPQSLYYRSVQAIDVHNDAAYGQEPGPQALKGSQKRGTGVGNE